jgi:hypothetical protein
VAYENNNEKKSEIVHSLRLKAGKKRTYFFDVRSTKNNDYCLSITESIKHFYDDGYDRHKIVVYKEDFNKFVKSLNEAVDHIKTNLMPDFNFDAFNHEYSDQENNGQYNTNQYNSSYSSNEGEAPSTTEHVDSY